LAGGEAARSHGGPPSFAPMNRQDLIDRVAQAAKLPRPEAARAVDAALATIEEALREGESVQLTGFGKFHVAQYTGRAGVNPRTGERIEVPTTAVPRFTAGVRLKQAVR
jgi:DNA-binding protein HU-beta